MSILQIYDIFREILKYMDHVDIVKLYCSSKTLKTALENPNTVRNIINMHDTNHDEIMKLGYNMDINYYLALCKSYHIFNHPYSRHLLYKSDDILYIPRRNFRNKTLTIVSKNLYIDKFNTCGIRKLVLCDCNLKYLPRLIPNDLEELYVSRNEIREIPEDYDFGNIKMLVIDDTANIEKNYNVFASNPNMEVTFV